MRVCWSSVSGPQHCTELEPPSAPVLYGVGLVLALAAVLAWVEYLAERRLGFHSR